MASQVLVHRARRLRSAHFSFAPIRLLRLCHWFLHLLVALLVCVFPKLCSGQVLYNGQVFTNGLAIVDSPAPGSVLRAGRPFSMAIDISGNGQLARQATLLGSTFATRFDSLEVYLVSAQSGSNFTVAVSPAMLAREPGSTVKHLDYTIPTCIVPGPYNLTIYEGSHLNNQPFFSITPIGVVIENPTAAPPCANSDNPYQAMFQPSFPLPTNPFLPSDVQPTPLFSGMATLPFSTSTTPPATETLTVTTTANPSQQSLTVIFISMVTTTLKGETSAFTTTVLATTTLTNPTPEGLGGFVPVNTCLGRAAPRLQPVYLAFLGALLHLL